MFPLFQTLGASPDCHNFSNMMDSGLATSSAGSLRTRRCTSGIGKLCCQKLVSELFRWANLECWLWGMPGVTGTPEGSWTPGESWGWSQVPGCREGDIKWRNQMSLEGPWLGDRAPKAVQGQTGGKWLRDTLARMCAFLREGLAIGAGLGMDGGNVRGKLPTFKLRLGGALSSLI